MEAFPSSADYDLDVIRMPGWPVSWGALERTVDIAIPITLTTTTAISGSKSLAARICALHQTWRVRRGSA